MGLALDAEWAVDDVTDEAVEAEGARSSRGRPRFLGAAAAAGATRLAGGDGGGENDGDSRLSDWGESEGDVVMVSWGRRSKVGTEASPHSDGVGEFVRAYVDGSNVVVAMGSKENPWVVLKFSKEFDVHL